MPKVTGASLPLSGLFAIDKPSGVVTMKLLNSINELLASSALFLPGPGAAEDAKAQRKARYQKGGKGKRGSRAGKVKLGQGGTLDPLASGVLVLGVNDGTKKLGDFLHGTKEYRATGLFGCATDSYDSDGKKVRNAPFKHVTREKVEAVLDRFRGEIKQLPPIYSALKMDGKPLYDYARQNKPLPRPVEARACTIYNLELIGFKRGGEHSWKGCQNELSEEEKEAMVRLERMVQESSEEAVKSQSSAGGAEEVHDAPEASTSALAPDAKVPEQEEHINGTDQTEHDLPPSFEIKMTVSSGTYVRSIVHDIGVALDSAAHVVELIRTRQGQFALDTLDVHKVEGQDSEELHSVVPWKVIQEGMDVLKSSKAERDSEVDEAAADESSAWEDAIVKALL